MYKLNEYFFPIENYSFGIPLRCNNNTVIDGQLNAFKTAILQDVIAFKTKLI